MKNRCLGLVVFVLTACTAFPFGGEGHRAIAAIALANLSPEAKAAIQGILGSETLMEAAMWPDEIKTPQGRLSTSPVARLFNQTHKDNKKWHYVNFPVASKRYSASSSFAYPHDIVQVITGCIVVLEGGDFLGLSQKEALRFLAHLVGDIHQPMHVVAGYYDLTDAAHPKLEADIAAISTDTNDSGGNSLDYGPGNMHSLWDTVLVNDVFATSNPEVLATEVMRDAPPLATYKTSGKTSTWAAKWAADSMKIARLAYADIEFGQATLTHDSLKSMAVTLKPTVQGYRTTHKVHAKEQLRKAGVHLAQLLNAIDWDEAR
jgi:hypothetical protein